MKEKWLLSIITVLFLSFISCDSDDSEELDGKWQDIIKISKKELSINAESNSVLITTEGASWWINGISLNGDSNYDLQQLDTSQDNFIIEENEFKVERKNAKELHIFMTENPTENKRSLIISLQAGNYFDGITIIQSGK
ncbi:hypothetical protein [Aureivirga sp. CE67]|uniref:hypothetical protein n=1 Tax=Aureivirga sp. CE67 TaxID=1788983 RepID=UPI0018CB86B7|nr:hypothetical protein [Aureivirga sp. CE67]